MNVNLSMDRALSGKMIRGLRKRQHKVSKLGRMLVVKTSHFGIARGRELTKEAITAHGAEIAAQETTWADAGISGAGNVAGALAGRYAHAGRLVAHRAAGGFLKYRYYKRRRTWKGKRKQTIKVYAEKTRRGARGWTTTVINRTKNILELDDRAQLGRRLALDMARESRKELVRLKRRIV